MTTDGLRAITNWDRIEHSVTVYRLGEQPPEAWFWREIRVEDRIEATERIRREHHEWERGHEPRFERIARLVELA